MSVRRVDGKLVSKLDISRPSPYLKKNWEIFLDSDDWETKRVIDIGCGGGRNSEFLKSVGFRNVMSLDWAGDYGIKWEARDPLPVGNSSADIILSNYFLMFLPPYSLSNVLNEIIRVSGDSCFLMIELYEAKTSFYPSRQECEQLLKNILKYYSAWTCVDIKGMRFILKKS